MSGSARKQDPLPENMISRGTGGEGRSERREHGEVVCGREEKQRK